MTEYVASRTLVKSPPELWAECSDAASLARHLDQFGEIRITRLEPETAVAWEGERARGTVRIEPSGWGTKVILTAVPVADEEVAAEAGEGVEPTEVAVPVAEVAEVREPETVAEVAEVREPETVAEPIPEAPADPEPDPEVALEAPPARRRRFRWFSFLRRRGPSHRSPRSTNPWS